jgi:cytochrome c553
MNRVIRTLAPVLAASLIVLSSSAGAVDTGQQKAAVCAACHGADGNSINPLWPKLAGQHPAYIEAQLKAFKAGTRKNPTMMPMASTLSEKDMQDLANYFASQKRTIGATKKDLAEAGAKIYRAGNSETGVPACMACHGPRGNGNAPAAYPALGGQHAEYVAKQLNAYKSGERTNDPNAIMRTIASRLSSKEIEAVSSYVEGLH